MEYKSKHLALSIVSIIVNFIVFLTVGKILKRDGLKTTRYSPVKDIDGDVNEILRRDGLKTTKYSPVKDIDVNGKSQEESKSKEQAQQTANHSQRDVADGPTLMWTPAGRLGNQLCEYVYLLKYREEYSAKVSEKIMEKMTVLKFKTYQYLSRSHSSQPSQMAKSYFLIILMRMKCYVSSIIF